MDFKKAIVDVQSGNVKYDVGGFFSGSVANNSSASDLNVQLGFEGKIISIVLKAGFMLQLSDVLLDYIICNGDFTICGLVKSKTQELPSIKLEVATLDIVNKLERLRTVLGDNLTTYTSTTAPYDIRYQLDSIRNLNMNIRDALIRPEGAETFTTTPLAANATYYSPARDFWASKLGHAGCIGFADQPSATDGVQAQLSIDGSNWDYVAAKTTASANVGVSLPAEVRARYLRFVWINGATAQTVFRFGGRYFI